MASVKSALDVLVTTAVAIAVGVMIAKGTSTRSEEREEPIPLPTSPVSLKGAQLLGDKNAPVALLEFSDFECPYCTMFARDVLPELQKTYISRGQLLVAFRQMPLSSHRTARSSAEVAVCAGKNDRFWRLHDWLFNAPENTDRQSVIQQAHQLNLDPAALDRCLATEASALVDADLSQADELSVTGTPTFFVGRLRNDRLDVTERLVGNQRLAVIAKAIETAGSIGKR